MKKIKEQPPVELLDELLAYDKETGEFLHRHRDIKFFNDTARQTKEHNQAIWNGRYAGTVAGNLNKSTGYRHIGIFGKTWLAHRIAYLMATGQDPLDMQIDHINQDKLDNRFSNLRLVTISDNNRNRSMQTNNTSGTMGISSYYHKPNCLIGKVQADGREVVIKNPRTGYGYFEDFEKPVLERMIADKYRELGFHENHGSLN